MTLLGKRNSVTAFGALLAAAVISGGAAGASSGSVAQTANVTPTSGEFTSQQAGMAPGRVSISIRPGSDPRSNGLEELEGSISACHTRFGIHEMFVSYNPKNDSFDYGRIKGLFYGAHLIWGKKVEIRGSWPTNDLATGDIRLTVKPHRGKRCASGWVSWQAARVPEQVEQPDPVE